MATTPYCDPADLPRFGVNAKALEAISVDDGQKPPIDAASDFMDGYLGKQFTLPLTVFGDDIRECCAIVTAFNVIGTKGFKPNENPEDSILLIRYNQKIRWLENIAKGLVTPVVTDSTPGGVPGVPPNGPVVMSNYSRGWQGDLGDNSRLPFAGRRR